jgi:hypothetical protein
MASWISCMHGKQQQAKTQGIGHNQQSPVSDMGAQGDCGEGQPVHWNGGHHGPEYKLAWLVGEGPHLLRPLIGLPLRSKGREWGWGWMSMGWRCAVRKWIVRCARAMTRSSMPLLAVPWMRAFEWRC